MSKTSFITIKSNYAFTKGESNPTSFKVEGLSCNTNSNKKVAAWNNEEVCLLSLHIVKELYSPNHIVGELQINTNDSSLSDIIIDSMLEGTIDMWNVENGVTKDIAKDYLIHEVVPTVYSDSNQSIRVTFHAYSPDVMLTYDKYSMAYTAKRLCDDIIPDQIESTLKDIYSMSRISIDTLHNTVCKDKEIIVPYLVQYNESFHDFLRRITYRSGEYMFFEDDKLHIGLNVPKAADVMTVKYNSRSGHGRHVSRFTSKKIASHHHNLNDGSLDDPFSSSVAYNEEYSQEDYAIQIRNNPKKVSWHKKGSTYIGLVTSMLSQANIADMIKTGAINAAKGSLMDLKSVSDSNEEFNKKHLFTEDKGKAAEKYDKEDATATNYYPYLVHGSFNNIISKAYREIREGEEQTESGCQKLVLEMDNYQHVCLGQIVKLKDDTRRGDGDSAFLYVVTKIERDENSEWNVKPGYYNIEVVPLRSAFGNNIFPPKQEIETVRYVGPQTAFVTSVKDVMGLGRVQVRFHWQTKDGDATPLVRLSSQMASGDAGVQFIPNENDEVIMNFTNGNVELPYVAGALFNQKNKAPGKTRAIRSSHGHTISFNDSGEDKDFAKSIFPIIDPIKNFIDLASNKDGKKKEAKEKVQRAKDECIKAEEKLKVETLNDKGKIVYADRYYKEYDRNCQKLKYRKEFVKKAATITLDTPLMTDDELLDSKYNAQNKKTPLNLPSTRQSKWEASNKMYCLRDEIKAMEAVVTEKSPVSEKNLLSDMKTFYDAAMALSLTDVIASSEDDKKSRQYDICAKEEKDKNSEKFNFLPNNDELESKSEGKNKIEKLQMLIDDVEKDMCEKILKPVNAGSNASQKYKDFVSAYDQLVKAKAEFDALKSEDNEEDSKFHTGGITIADDCGLYKLDLNATKRSITIDSPMGTVKINALTGITISAPNGDVKISGKNVTIDAGNNLTLSAGGNRKKLAKFKKTWKEGKAEWTGDVILEAAAAAAEFIPEKASGIFPKPPVDMAALRCVIEAITKPIEGTLKIHTENNLMLESGGENTSADMSNMSHTYNQLQLNSKRSTMVAATAKTLNDMFDDISKTVTSCLAEHDEKYTKLKDYIMAYSTANSFKKFAIEGLGRKFGKTVPADVLAAIVSDADAHPEKKYELKDIYAPVNDANALDKLEAISKIKFHTDPGDDDKLKETFNRSRKVRSGLSEMEKLLKLVNAYVASIPTEIFKKKGNEIQSFRTKIKTKLYDKKTPICDYLKDDYFNTLGTWVNGLKIAEITENGAKKKVVQDSNNTKVDKTLLLNKKREGFHQILTAMVKSNASSNKVKDFIKTAFGYGNNSMAYYNDNDGKLPALTSLTTDDKWNKFIETFDECSFDDNKYAEYANKVVSKVEEVFLGSSISDTKAGIEGIFTEWSSLSTEAQGNIYLTSKGQGTAKLNGTSLQPSDAIPNKFDDIMKSFKKTVS